MQTVGDHGVYQEKRLVCGRCLEVVGGYEGYGQSGASGVSERASERASGRASGRASKRASGRKCKLLSREKKASFVNHQIPKVGNKGHHYAQLSVIPLNHYWYQYIWVGLERS